MVIKNCSLVKEKSRSDKATLIITSGNVWHGYQKGNISGASRFLSMLFYRDPTLLRTLDL